MLVGAGYTVLVDATFLLRAQRRPFVEWADGEHLPLAILNVQAPQQVLRERIASRARRGGDASEANLAVLERQLTLREALTPDEIEMTIACDTGSSTSPQFDVDLIPALSMQLRKAP